MTGSLFHEYDQSLPFPWSNLASFDFIAVSEFLDASLVLLHLKLKNLELGDILCYETIHGGDDLNDKQLRNAFVQVEDLELDLDLADDYDKCHAQADIIRAQNRLDELLYQEALRAFNATVNAIGRGTMDDLMDLYYYLKSTICDHAYKGNAGDKVDDAVELWTRPSTRLTD